jgi:hypothetical protein
LSTFFFLTQFATYIEKGRIELIDKLALERFMALELPSEEKYICDFRCWTPTGDSIAEGCAIIPAVKLTINFLFPF